MFRCSHTVFREETAFLDYPDWGFSVLFLSCKANARVKLAKSGHGPHLFRIVICVVLAIVLCCCVYAVLLLLCCTVIVLLCYYLCYPVYWSCVLYHCHWVLTQLQSTNISIYLIEWLEGNDCYTLAYALFSWAENSQILSDSFFRRLRVWNDSDVVNLSYQSIHKSFSIWINVLWKQVT